MQRAVSPALAEKIDLPATSVMASLSSSFCDYTGGGRGRGGQPFRGILHYMASLSPAWDT